MVLRKLSTSFLRNFAKFCASKLEKGVTLQRPGWHSLTRLSSRTFLMQPSVNTIAIRGISTFEHGKQNYTFKILDCKDLHSSPMVCRRCYAVKSPSSNPRDRDKEDPLARFGGLDPSTPKLGFEKVKDLMDASEAVKKIFSLEFADDKEINAYRRAKLVKAVQKDATDQSSLPVRITLQTLNIRNAAKQLSLARKDMGAKQRLLGIIGRRRRTLKYLRQTDYERFERLLKELRITYVLPPAHVRYHTRRYLEKLVVRKKAREEKLKALREFLDDRKEKQLREIAILKNELGHELTKEDEEILARMKDDS